MAKLTEAGALYLKDFYILTEAREEMENYLDKVLSSVHLKIADMVQELADDITKWGVWRNQASLGYMQITIQLLKDDPNIRRGKSSDVFVVYRDVRHLSRIKEPYSVELDVTTHGQAKLLGQEIERLSANLFGSNILRKHYPSLIPESSDESADNIFDVAQDICMQLKKIIDSIVIKN